MTILDPVKLPRQNRSPSATAVPDARVSFRQPVSVEGFVDAAWWPRSRELAVELPPLLDLLLTAGRDVHRVSYNLDYWRPTPRQLKIYGHVIKVSGYRWQNPLLLSIVDLWGRERIDVLVIDPLTPPAIAQRAFALAGQSDGMSRPEQIMALAVSDPN